VNPSAHLEAKISILPKFRGQKHLERGDLVKVRVTVTLAVIRVIAGIRAECFRLRPDDYNPGLADAW
jgi:DUF1365 family protein